MTVEEVITQIKQLSVEDRRALYEWLARELSSERAPTKSISSSASRVRGLLRTDPVPSDEEISDAYADYLIEKYK